VQTVVETPGFLNEAESLGLRDEARIAIVTWVAANPAAGKVIEGTGGARKVRFAGRGKGKRGGYRVITFFAGADIPALFLNIFAKNEKTDLTPTERPVLKDVLEHWEHGRRTPSGAARAFLTVIAREPDAVRRALID